MQPTGVHGFAGLLACHQHLPSAGGRFDLDLMHSLAASHGGPGQLVAPRYQVGATKLCLAAAAAARPSWLAGRTRTCGCTAGRPCAKLASGRLWQVWQPAQHPFLSHEVGIVVLAM
jgi:hypothetical protein